MTRWPLLAHRRVVTALAVVAVASGSGVAVPAARAAGATPATTQATAPAAKHGTLSPRLARLAGSSTFASPRALSVPASGVGSLVRRRDGRVLVEIRTADTSSAGVTALRKLGARVVNVSPAYQTVTAAVAPSALRAIAADADVHYVSEVLAPEVGRTTSAPHAGGVTTATACAPIVSEGDSLMNVAAARTNNSIDGAGRTIGILSDSFNTDTGAATHAAGDVANGELPGAGNPCGRTTPVVVQADYSGGGQSDEGRAMAQLAHDLAPGARLAFATAYNGPLDFASQINQLRTVNHASVIVDDISYLDEPFFQDGPIANAANAASAAGVPYFSAAGNSNVIVGGKNVSSYETPLLRSSVSCPAAIGSIEPTVGCHDFDTTVGTDTGDDITLAPGGGFVLDLQWAQPRGGVTADYDAFVLSAGGAVLSGSNSDNLASQKPFEVFSYQNTTASSQTVRIVVAKYSGPNVRTKFVLLGAAGITAVQYNTSTSGDIVGPSIFGHNGTSTVASTAAIPYDDSGTSEDYSSRGPVTLYFQPTPSTAALGAPQVLNQPSFAATDGVRTSFFAQQIGGVWRFYGTSAAAPQAAAIGALLQEHDPALAPAQLISTLADTAQPVATNGTPDAVGGGYLDADAALASVVALPGAPGQVTATSGNGQATVQWSAAATDPNFPRTSYVITPALSGVPQPDQTIAPSATSATVTSLTNGGSYTFTVKATNANGSGPSSAPTAAITIGTPGRPTSAVASPGDAQATISWTAPTVTNGSAISGYQITPSVGGVAQSPQTFNSPATTETVTGLTNSTSATFTVAAVNANGAGPASTPTAGIIVGTPATPARPTVSPLAGAVSVGWTPTASNGAPLLSYFVTLYLNGTSAIATKQLSPGTLSTSFSGLSNGATYAAGVYATNSRGQGPQSALSLKVIAGSPTAPTAVTSTPGNGTATVSWAASAGNGAGVTRYTVTPYIGGVAQTARVFNDTATSHVITGLTNGSSYQFAVAGTNSRGLGPKSALTPARVIGAPLAPTAPTATPGDASASVHLTAPTVNNGAAITGYVITPYIAGVAQSPLTFNSTATTETVGGLTNTTSYRFRIAAVNARGIGVNSGATLAVTVGAPKAPTGVTAATAGAHTVTVHWTAPANNGAGISGYIVTPYIGTVAKTPRQFNNTATTQTITGLTTGQKYTFKVSAINARGTGPQSAASNVVTVT